ncbi:MAG TPA: hypothetical protein VHN15_03660, partial [Thermoanaerobaculia bacterium]|nr:hypothetical protein [Thermoanaerobaculia bacterium]
MSARGCGRAWQPVLRSSGAPTQPTLKGSTDLKNPHRSPQALTRTLPPSRAETRIADGHRRPPRCWTHTLPPPAGTELPCWTPTL